MKRHRRLRTRSRAGLALLAVLLVAPGRPAAGAMVDRIYLLASDSGQLTYSVDAADPEAALTTIHRHCPGGGYLPNGAEPCLSSTVPSATGGPFLHGLFWMPGALFLSPVTWSPEEPIRFHLELGVTPAVPFTVHVGLQKGTTQTESSPATEVAPGVWEGSLTGGGPLASGATVDLIFVRIRTSAPHIDVTMGLGGGSYLELPEPVQARGVPQLLEEHTYHPNRTSFSTPERSFWFNDANWEVSSFQGDLTQARQFQVEVARRAPILLAWVEAYETPFVHDVRRGRAPDTRKLLDTPVITLSREGEVIERGENDGTVGRGGDALAVSAVAPGSVTLEVRPPNLGGQVQSHPYTAHVLRIYGDRTLERMRWSFQVSHEGQLPAFRIPGASFCPAIAEVVPTTEQVTTFSADLDWDGEALPDPGWAISFSLPTVGGFICGAAGTGDRVRITVPGERVWSLGAGPAPGATVVTWHDMVFELDVRYAYAPPPAEST